MLRKQMKRGAAALCTHEPWHGPLDAAANWGGECGAVVDITQETPSASDFDQRGQMREVIDTGLPQESYLRPQQCGARPLVSEQSEFGQHAPRVPV